MNYRRIYLDGYSYFLTLVTQGRKPLLVENIELLRDAFRRSKRKYRYTIDAIVVLPDHIHMIITPEVATDYSKIIAHIKRSFVYGLDENIKAQANLKLAMQNTKEDIQEFGKRDSTNTPYETKKICKKRGNISKITP